TEPDFSAVKPGDDVTITGTGANDGTFRVLKAQEKRKQVTDAQIIRSQDITTGDYWLYDTPTTGYYVWYNKAGGGGDPAVAGRTGIEVAVGTNDTSQQNALATALAMDAVVGITAAVLSGSVVRVTNDDFGPSTDAANGNMGAGFAVSTY